MLNKCPKIREKALTQELCFSVSNSTRARIRNGMEMEPRKWVYAGVVSLSVANGWEPRHAMWPIEMDSLFVVRRLFQLSPHSCVFDKIFTAIANNKTEMERWISGNCFWVLVRQNLFAKEPIAGKIQNSEDKGNWTRRGKGAGCVFVASSLHIINFVH